MAKFIAAFQQYGPKLVLKTLVELKLVAERLAERTGLNKSEVMMVQQEQSEAILYFTKLGMPVKLPGIGVFTPSIDRGGKISINFRADPVLRNGINAYQVFDGEIANRVRIGWTNEQYKELWDSEHPEDPLEMPSQPAPEGEN